MPDRRSQRGRIRSIESTGSPSYLPCVFRGRQTVHPSPEPGGGCLLRVQPSSRLAFRNALQILFAFRRDLLNLLQHLLHAASYFFAFLPQRDQFLLRRIQLFFARLELLPQPRVVAFNACLGFTCCFQQFDRPVNFFFQRLEILIVPSQQRSFFPFCRHALHILGGKCSSSSAV